MYTNTDIVHSLPPGLAVTARDADLGRLVDGALERPPRLASFDETHPAHVQILAAFAQEILEKYYAKELRRPSPFSVILRDLSSEELRGSTHPLTGNVLLSNILVGREAFSTLAHEIFHRIQYEYVRCNWEAFYPSAPPSVPAGTAGPGCSKRVRQEAVALPASADIGIAGQRAIIEGGARFAENALLPSYDRYIESAASWFDAPVQPLFGATDYNPGVQVVASYGAGLFWKYFASQHGTPGSGLETQKVLLERLEMFRVQSGGSECKITFDPLILREARRQLAGPGHFDKFLHGDQGGQICAETTWGNFLAALVLNGGAERDRRFSLGFTAVRQGPASRRMQVGAGQVFQADDLPVSAARREEIGSGPIEIVIEPEEWSLSRQREWLRLGLASVGLSEGHEPNRPVKRQPVVALYPYSARTYRIEMQPDGQNRLIRVRARRKRGLGDGFIQVLTVGPDARLLDLYRADLADRVDKTFSCVGATAVVVQVAAREQAGDFSLALSRVKDLPVLCATNWNCVAGRNMSIDPFGQAWNWRSADIFFEDIGAAGRPSAVTVRARNIGTGTANNTVVQMSCKLKDKLFDKSVNWGHLTPTTENSGRRISENKIFTDLLSKDDCVRKESYLFSNRECADSVSGWEQIFEFGWPSNLSPKDYIVRANISCRESTDSNDIIIFSSSDGSGPNQGCDTLNFRFS